MESPEPFYQSRDRNLISECVREFARSIKYEWRAFRAKEKCERNVRLGDLGTQMFVCAESDSFP